MDQNSMILPLICITWWRRIGK